MINKPPPFKGLRIRIPTITPIKGRGFIDQGSGIGIVQLEWFLGSGLRLTQGGWGFGLGVWSFSSGWRSKCLRVGLGVFGLRSNPKP